MSERLVNLIYSKVDWAHSDNSDAVTIDFDPSTVLKTTRGTGVLYFYDEGWSNELSFIQTIPADFLPGPGRISLVFDKLARFPCTGIITNENEGYLIAPTAKIEADAGKNIAIMLLSPRTFPHGVTVDKPGLSIPNEANLAITSDAGQLQIKGTITGTKSEAVRLVLNRNPHLPIYRAGYNEQLVEFTQPGEINATWKPVGRVFQDLLLAFYPSTIGGDDLEGVAHMLGAPEGDYNVAATVVGDGLFTDYKLRLTVEHQFRTVSDETRLVVI